MKTYRVTLEGDFVMKAKDTETIRKGLLKVLTENGFSDIGFEIGIENVKKAKEVNNGS